MLLGVKAILGKLTASDEYGIYRINDDGQPFLMFSCSTYKEANKYGRLVAQVLNKPFEDRLPAPDGVSPQVSEPEVSLSKTYLKEPSAKPKRVSGVGKRIKSMLVDGAADKDIVASLLPLYLEAGRSEKEAVSYILSYIKDIKSGKY